MWANASARARVRLHNVVACVRASLDNVGACVCVRLDNVGARAARRTSKHLDPKAGPSQ